MINNLTGYKPKINITEGIGKFVEWYNCTKNIEKKIAVVGLGYVGLPLAIEFGCKFKTIGFDKDIEKNKSLSTGYDPNEEIGSSQFKKSKKLKFTNQEDDLKSIDIFIIAVPTPVDESKVPDFSFVVKATELIAKNMKKGA